MGLPVIGCAAIAGVSGVASFAMTAGTVSGYVGYSSNGGSIGAAGSLSPVTFRGSAINVLVDNPLDFTSKILEIEGDHTADSFWSLLEVYSGGSLLGNMIRGDLAFPNGTYFGASNSTQWVLPLSTFGLVNGNSYEVRIYDA